MVSSLRTESDPAGTPSTHGPDARFSFTAYLVLIALAGAGFGMTASITVLYAVEFGASDTVAGLVWASIALGLLAVDVVGTRLVPRLDGRSVLWISLGVFSAGLVVSGLAPNLAIVVAGRIVQGAGAAVAMSGALQVVVRNSSPDRVGRDIGAFNAAWFAGISTGPLVGGGLSEIGDGLVGFRIAFLVSAALCLAVAVGARVALPSLPTGQRPRLSRPSYPSARPGLRTWPALGLGLFGEALRGGVVFTLIPLFGSQHLGVGTGTIGLALSALAVVDVASMRVGGALADRVGRNVVLAVALAVGAAACLSAPLVDSVPTFVLWCALLGAPVAAAWVVPAAMVVDVSADHQAGLAAYRIAGDAGDAVGPTAAAAAVGAAGPLGAAIGIGAGTLAVAAWVWRLTDARVHPLSRAAAAAEHPVPPAA